MNEKMEKNRFTNNQIIYPGDYYVESTQNVIYFVAKKEDIVPQVLIAKDKKLINDFLAIKIDNSIDILNFTKKYGPIINIGWDEFEKVALEEKKSSFLLMKEKYPFKDVYAFPAYQFTYFYHLIVNIWELKRDIDQIAASKTFLRNFLCLLFQPYAKSDFEDSYLGIPSDGLLGRFSYFYFQSVKKEIGTMTVTSFLKALKEILIHNLEVNKGKTEEDYLWIYTEAPIINKETMEQWTITFPKELFIYTLLGYYDELLSVLRELVKTHIFDYLNASDEEIKYEVKNPDYQIYERVRELSRMLIKDIVNTYISPLRLNVNEKSGYEMANSPDYLVQILFNALSQTLVNCEVRVCKFRNCKNRFIVEKTKKNRFCCKACTDKEKKYKKRNKEE